MYVSDVGTIYLDIDYLPNIKIDILHITNQNVGSSEYLLYYTRSKYMFRSKIRKATVEEHQVVTVCLFQSFKFVQVGKNF